MSGIASGRSIVNVDPSPGTLSEAVPGEPLGAWLDEAGARWLPQPDGSWKKAD